jgi:hypothetical protein
LGAGLVNFNEKSLKTKALHGWVFTLLAVAVVSCSPGASVPVTTQCVVNADQTTSFKGHWTSHPIPLAVVANDFTASELASLEAAIGTWNTFFNTSKGFELYLSNSSASAVPLTTSSAGGARITSATACSQSLINPNGFSGSIMIYKNTTTWTYGSAIMALTSLCPETTSNSAYRMFTSAVMELNYIDYFQPGKPIPDLQTEVTHELGHVLGLDHSCNGDACTNAPADYASAVMYPTIGFNGINGDVNRELQTNDQQRANCLY